MMRNPFDEKLHCAPTSTGTSCDLTNTDSPFQNPAQWPSIFPDCFEAVSSESEENGVTPVLKILAAGSLIRNEKCVAHFSALFLATFWKFKYNRGRATRIDFRRTSRDRRAAE